MSDKKKQAGNFIKHFLLDPIKTPSEASARIKELIPYLAISFGGVVVFILLGNLIEPVKIVFDIIGYLCMACVFFFGWCMFRAIQLKKKLGNLECSNCKNIIKYDDNVSYKINLQKFNITQHKTQNSKAGMDIYVSGFEQVGMTITCKCQECGTEKTFNHIFNPIKVEGKKKIGVSALNADLLLQDMEKTMMAHYQTRFANAPSDYKIKKNVTVDQAVKEYFCDDGTASKMGSTTVTATKK